MNETYTEAKHEIRGDAKSILDLLGKAKFSIDYYQREYRWEKEHITELINDLSGKFLESHNASNDRSMVVAEYGHYFLGSIIISKKGNIKFVIDGQQRLTSITLILIYLHQQLKDADQKNAIADLIFSYKVGGGRSFNLDVPERTACMEALFTGRPFEESDQRESVLNIVKRFSDIVESFPEELTGEALPYFADWLIANVHLVEITAYTDSDAYAIFEAMNDRGLSLTPTDMLKGYLLASITDIDSRNTASVAWRKRIESLKKIGKDEDAHAIKSWLRSQYAISIRERKRDAQPRDFDLIGTEFHRWVRNNKEILNLTDNRSFSRLIQEEFAFYSSMYEKIRNSTATLTKGLEAIYYNAQNNFTLQYPVLLAPLQKNDTEEVILRKLRIVAGYIDILITRRIWNGRSTSYSALQYNMFQLVILEIRGKSVSDLAEVLLKRLLAEEETFSSNERFSLNKMNGQHIHRILARMTDFIETRSGRHSRYVEYLKRGKKGYEVEHIWANHHERHTEEFGHPADFSEYRDRIGGLLLLPQSFNGSYGDLPYCSDDVQKGKYDYYYGENLLARSLNKNAYEHDPGFREFQEESGLPFCWHLEFKKADLDVRQELYRQIAEKIWNPDNLKLEAKE